MEVHENILSMFRAINYEPLSLLTKQEMMNALNMLMAQNTEYQQFSTQMSDELWENCPKVQGRLIVIQNLVSTIVEAEKQLRYQIKQIEIQLGKNLPKVDRKCKLLELYTVYHEHKFLTQIFSMPVYPQTSLLAEAISLVPDQYKDQTNHIFAWEPNLETTGLKLVLWLAMMCLGLQMIIMFHKQHFYTLLTLCAVLGIFFLNYFDAVYLRIVLVNLFVSCIFDIVWEIAKAKIYWDQRGITLSSSLQAHFLKFITIFVVLIAVSKLMMIAILFKYRSNPHGMKKTVQFFKLKFNLNADPYHNPISLLFIT